MFKRSLHFWWVAIALCLVTFISRSPFTGFNSIIKAVEAEFGLSKTVLGLLISLPTFVMAIYSGFVDRLNNKYGAVKALFISLIAIFIGLLLRDVISGLGGSHLSPIFIGTLLLSLGITVMNVIYPVFLNLFFVKQMNVMSGINSANFSISSLAGTFAALIMIDYGYTWREAGVVWLVITLLVILFYLPVFKFTAGLPDGRPISEEVTTNELNQETATAEVKDTKPAKSMWLQLPAWGIAMALGFESANYYFAFSWFPKLIGDTLTNNQLTTLITVYQFLSIPLSFFAPAILIKYAKQQNLLMFIFSSLLAISSIAMIVVTNYILLLVIFAIFGLTAGLLFSCYMTLISLKTKDPKNTAKLSAMAQSVAFLVTSIHLLGFGMSYDITGSYNFAIIATIILSLLIPVFTWFATAFEVKE